ncbi:hypothetical protein LKI_10821 (plasmid) [Leuconostoc kimchii IMSNU 11154]|uniref:Uncharacterized protein n=1 Tax=Leuconostoc kimchii (strain IMSNU 11154 / KCTC 2386 / IH25) TaxID=762051 RepID=D5SZU4_LEUKI|nr:hypothetical protein [Leuconostoc kimchii]ADG39543.1 hypothetical protein LKI_10821 [Leuconostoc kimchii IMSNU 11154]
MSEKILSIVAAVSLGVFGILLSYLALTLNEKKLKNIIDDPNGSEYDFIILIILGLSWIGQKINFGKITGVKVITFVVGIICIVLSGVYIFAYILA